MMLTFDRFGRRCSIALLLAFAVPTLVPATVEANHGEIVTILPETTAAGRFSPAVVVATNNHIMFVHQDGLSVPNFHQISTDINANVGCMSPDFFQIDFGQSVVVDISGCGPPGTIISYSCYVHLVNGMPLMVGQIVVT